MASTPTNGGTLLYRVQELEGRLRDTNRTADTADREAGLLRVRVEGIEVALGDLRQELKGIRRGLWMAAVTFASLAVGVFTLIVQGAAR